MSCVAGLVFGTHVTIHLPIARSIAEGIVEALVQICCTSGCLAGVGGNAPTTEIAERLREVNFVIIVVGIAILLKSLISAFAGHVHQLLTVVVVQSIWKWTSGGLSGWMLIVVDLLHLSCDFPRRNNRGMGGKEGAESLW